ncbi:DUF998 domain-containing protein [Fretibacter rubidus]|uniref:DUF998 domain-containing protein n=1 Tax=Fretibacter rubidus TaxID=570162 RepID=UPI00352A10E8
MINLHSDKTRKGLGAFALIGCVVTVFCDVFMWFWVKGYNPISQTISELAAGPHHWLQDFGLMIFVASTLCLALDLFLRGEKGWKPWLVRLSMLALALALTITLIALWNEYGDGEAGGLVIHNYLVALLYPLVPVVLWFGTSVLPARKGDMSLLAKVTAVVWLFIAPVFFIVPTTIDGAYERGLGMIMITAVMIAAWRLYKDPSSAD